jgi:type IV secretion system protein VirB5
MRFRRASVSYGQSPEPQTPYQRAGQVWDERLGSARVQARNWRAMAFAAVTVCGFMAVGLVWQLGRSTVTPYVVEVGQAGEVRAVGPADPLYRPTDAQIAFHLAHFIVDVRSVPTDPIVVRRDWLEAYDFTTDRGAAVVNDYARADDPFARIGKTTVAADVISVVRASPESFQVRWVERTYEAGALIATDHWTAIASIIVQPPKTAERLRKNPLGIYINGLNWSRELAPAAGASGDPK